ncbi:MAG: tetratricopeptide repeat protein, partial [Thermoplasmata archaeon]
AIWSDRAWILDKLKRYSEAADSFQKAIELDGGDGELWKGKGLMLHKEGDLKAALKAYEGAAKLDNKDKDAWKEIGTILIDSEKYKQSLLAFDKLLALDPSDTDTLRQKKEALLRLNIYEDAIEVCDRILELEPNDHSTAGEKGSLLLRTGRHQEALKMLDSVLSHDSKNMEALIGKKEAYKALKQPDKVLSTCKSIVTFYPDDKECWVDMGIVLEEMGQLEQAVSSLKSAIKIEPEDLKVLQRIKNILKRLGKHKAIISVCERILKIEGENKEALDDKGSSLLAMGRYEEAQEVFDTLLKLEPKNIDFLNKKGKALSMQKAYKEAIRCFDEALKLNPKSRNILVNKGDALRALGESSYAVKCFDRALKIDDNDVNLLDKKGRILLELQMYDKSLDSFGRALEIDKSNINYQYSRGFVLAKLKRNEEALTAFQSIIEIDPNNDRALMGIGRVRARMGKDKDALSAFEKALSINPDNIDALTAKKDVLLKLEDFLSADTTCNTILKKDPTDVQTWKDKARALTQLGKYKEALRAFDKALALEPEDLSFLKEKIKVLKLYGKHDDVISSTDMILKSQPEDIESLRDKGEALVNLKKHKEAVVIFDRILSSHPEDTISLKSKGRALFGLKRYEEALKCYDDALVLSKEDKTLWNEKGIVLVKLKDYMKAIECFEKGLDLDAKDEVIWRNKAISLFWTGRHNDGIKALDRALELGAKTKSLEVIQKGITVEVNVLAEIVNSFGEGEQKNRFKRLIEEARGAQQRKRFKEAHKAAVNCWDSVGENIGSSLKVINDRIAMLKDMGKDVSHLEKNGNEIKTLFNGEKYSKALIAIRKTMGDINSHLEDVVSNLYTKINKEIQNARDSGLNTTDLTKRMREANKAYGSKMYKKAYNELVECEAEMHSMMEKHRELTEKIIAQRNRVEEAGKKGINVSAPMRTLERVVSAVKASRYGDASDLLSECESQLSSLILEQSVQEQIELGKKFIQVAQALKLDTSDLEQRMANVNTYLEKKEYKEALKLAKNNAMDAHAICKKKTQELLSKAQSAIVEARKINMDVLSAEALFQKAKEAQLKVQYDETVRYANACIEEIEVIKDESERAASIIRLAQEHILDAKILGAKVGPAQTLLDEAYYELKNSDYSTSIDLGKKSIEMAQTAQEHALADVISEYQSIIDESKKEGVDVSSAVKLMENARASSEAKDYKNALKLSMQSEVAVNKVNLQNKMITEMISRIESAVSEAEKNGVQCKPVKTLLTEATSALRNELFAKALESAQDAGSRLHEAKKMNEKAKTTLYAASARMNEGEKLGVAITKEKELHKKAEKAFNDADYPVSLEASKEIIVNMKKLLMDHLAQPIESCEQLMKSAQNMGVDVRRADNILKEAKVALEEELYSQVGLFTKNCRKLVERELSGALFKQLFNLRSTLSKAKNEKGDLTEEEQMLNSAESCLENHKYLDATEYIQKVKESLRSPEK